MNNNTTITIDLTKDVFQVTVFNKYGNTLINKAMSPKKILGFIINYPEAAIYMEACGSEHYWGRQFRQHGYNVQDA